MTPEDIKTIIETIIENKVKYFWFYVLASFAFGILSSFFIEFFKTKGKNLATKSDINILTQKMESVKYEYLRKIEEYKKEISVKYELEKELLKSKIDVYKVATALKTTILRRKANLGNESELMKQFTDTIPELLILIHSHYKIREDLSEEIKDLEEYYNEFVSYIMKLRGSGEAKYHLELQKIEQIIDNIQQKSLA